jgi:hypothetical protein
LEGIRIEECNAWEGGIQVRRMVREGFAEPG